MTSYAIFAHQGRHVSAPRAGLMLRPLALALSTASMLFAALPAQAQFSSSGSVNVNPGNLAVPDGAGNADLGLSTLSVGFEGNGSFSALGGSELRVGLIRIGTGASGLGNGSVLMDGAGTHVNLVGLGPTSSSDRLEVGHYGVGQLTVSGGATLDGLQETSNCAGSPFACNAVIGFAAGSRGALTISGAGSSASFLRGFIVGAPTVYAPGFGTSGAASQGRVSVLAGGMLTTEGAQLGVMPQGGAGLTGSERSFADVVIDGPGSVWRVTGGTLGSNRVLFDMAVHSGATAAATISNGGRLWIEGKSGLTSDLSLTSSSSPGGNASLLVTGATSSVLFTGDDGTLTVGRNNGTAKMDVTNGALVSGMNALRVGRGGGTGTLSINGTGSEVRVNGVSTTAASGGIFAAGADIGRNGGVGTVNVFAGGRMSIIGGVPSLDNNNITSPALNLGREFSSAIGILNIDGAGSVVSLSSSSAVSGGGATEAGNPLARIGRNGTGRLNITNGGKLLLDGQALSTVAGVRSTALYIGGESAGSNGGTGIATVSGTGSEIRITGSDRYLSVGHGPQSVGQLSVSNGGLVSATSMTVGRNGGSGTLAIDHATLALDGQLTGQFGGAYLVVGQSDGVGVATVSNGGAMTLSNMGSSGAGLILGGITSNPGGNGTFILAGGALGGSSLTVTAAPGTAEAVIGLNGTGLMRLSGGSSLNLGDGNLYLARQTGAVGILTAKENSVINAGWVGVGRASSQINGGAGTLLLNNSTLNANKVVIGSNGILGGSGGVINAPEIINYGIFSPGSSPGTFTINGNYTAGAGSKLILEVEANGSGGFNTDQVLFTQGNAIDLSNLNIEYRFLGHTDPNAFKASGKFDIDTFLGFSAPGGGMTALGDNTYNGVLFSATAVDYKISNFSYSATGTASFLAAPVPEPSSWAMMFAGVALLAGMARRRAVRKA
jgi:T5SS/PEP-CTERM-associated repeat protein